MIADLTKRYSNPDPKFAGAKTDFSDLAKLDFDLAKPIMQEVDRVMQRYGVIPSFRGVKVPATAKGGTIAEIKRLDPNVPGSYMLLPEKVWTQSHIDSLFKSETTSNTSWAVMSKAKTRDDWIRSTITHEMGHEYMGLNLWSRFGNKGDEIRAKVDAWFKGEGVEGKGYLGTYKTDKLTTYGASNEHEAWAEAFAAAVGPIQLDDPRIVELRAILNGEYPLPAAAVEDQQRIFWANSKKQPLDPQTRAAVHAAHIEYLAMQMASNPKLAEVRVSMELLDQVPEIHEVLLAAGGEVITAGKKQVLTISRAQFMELASAIGNNAPLTPVAGHIPTGAMKPTAKVVSAVHGYDLATVGPMATAAEHGVSSVGTSMVTIPMPAGGTAQFQHLPAAYDPTLVQVFGGIMEGAPGSGADAWAVELGALSAWLKANPGVTKVRLTVGSDQAAKDFLGKVGLSSPEGLGGAMDATAAQIHAYADELYTTLSGHGYDTALMSELAVPGAVLPGAATPAAPLAEYGLDGPTFAAATPVTELEVGIQHNVVWTGPANEALYVEWNEAGGSLLWTSVSGTSMSASQRRAITARQIGYFADRAELYGLDALHIEASVVQDITDGVRRILTDAGGVQHGNGAMVVTAEQLIAARTTLATPTALVDELPPLGAPAADVLDYTPEYALGSASPSSDGYVLSWNGIQTSGVSVGTVDFDAGILKFAGTRPQDATGWASVFQALSDAMGQSPGLQHVLLPSDMPTDVLKYVALHGGTSKMGAPYLSREQLGNLVDGMALEPSPVTAATATVLDYDALAVSNAIADFVPPGEYAQTGLEYLAKSIDEVKPFSAPSGATVQATRTELGPGVMYWHSPPSAPVIEVLGMVADQPGFIAGIAKIGGALDADPSRATVLWSVPAGLEPWQRTLLEAAGGIDTPLGMSLSRDSVLMLRDELIAGAKSATVGAPLPTGSAIQELKATAVTSTAKIDAYTPLSTTVYGGTDTVKWRRLSNDLQIHAAIGWEGAIKREAWDAHLVSMADAMAGNEKIKVLRIYADAMGSAPPGWADELVDAQLGKVGKGGQLVLTRDEVLQLRDTILATPSPAALAPEPVLAPQYGFNAQMAGEATSVITPLKYDFERHDYTVNGQEVAIRHRTSSKGILWTGVSGGTESGRIDAMARHLVTMGDKVASVPTMSLVRFEALDKLPTGIRQMLEAYGAEQTGKYLVIGRGQFLSLREALSVELGQSAAKTVVASVVPPPAASDQSLHALTGAIQVEPTTKIVSTGGSSFEMDYGFGAVKMEIVPDGAGVAMQFNGIVDAPGAPAGESAGMVHVGAPAAGGEGRQRQLHRAAHPVSDVLGSPELGHTAAQRAGGGRSHRRGRSPGDRRRPRSAPGQGARRGHGHRAELVAADARAGQGHGRDGRLRRKAARADRLRPRRAHRPRAHRRADGDGHRSDRHAHRQRADRRCRHRDSHRRQLVRGPRGVHQAARHAGQAPARHEAARDGGALLGGHRRSQRLDQRLHHRHGRLAVPDRRDGRAEGGGRGTVRRRPDDAVHQQGGHARLRAEDQPGRTAEARPSGLGRHGDAASCRARPGGDRAARPSGPGGRRGVRQQGQRLQGRLDADLDDMGSRVRARLVDGGLDSGAGQDSLDGGLGDHAAQRRRASQALPRAHVRAHQARGRRPVRGEDRRQQRRAVPDGRRQADRRARGVRGQLRRWWPGADARAGARAEGGAGGRARDRADQRRRSWQPELAGETGTSPRSRPSTTSGSPGRRS